ncbi:PhaM family polyhydroxyalkanoate granule multifunctional regulatory protein [Polynucleobacter sp. MG-28-Ekke-A2]|uniref:PhaM family polyhydroxyalkanoate granule multifunctional regulatory protein n=1 Tax=Polynucleobacter sp. MG-28-Ekke-A2 TaxID=3108276 RepID=UPI002B227D80|nr:PhaM family polyhydroxyalkanoate granule multifunctional regulatory protein [Polynucleobacter sp. MG-28-Ekke-A2]MEA9600572.1 PhaM family polyhydroxyalkanoate granule multifunctional regulatory protein [Polynucleobacter sp. MG-28-Ekke-A2]
MFGTIPEFNQSLDMFKTIWGQGAAGQAGQFPFTADASKAAGGFASAFPGLDVDELEKRIKDLKSVENWLNLNLNILKSTIQGLEVQHATMMALKSFGDAVSAAGAAASSTSAPKEESKTKTTSAKPRKTATRRPRKAGDATFLDEVGNSDEQ